MGRGGRKALLIGIDAYPFLASHQKLCGAVNDVRAMAEYLVRDLGFAEEDLRLLLAGEATRQGILEAFARLVEEADEDDLVVVHYSGHGSRVRAAESRGGDAWEETIVPCDSGRGEYPSRDVGSSELRQLLLRLTEKTQRLTLVFDCCHSGTLTRDPFAARSRWVPPAEGGPPVRQVDDGSPPAYLPYNRRYTLIAACRRNETARELVPPGGEQGHHGALTHHLLAELHRAPARATWRDVVEAVAAAVAARFRDQHPQLVGAADRELFGLAERRPMRYVRVCARDPGRRRVVLDAGVIQGVGRGSRWAVYPAGTKTVEEDTPVLANLEVTAVRTTTADAKAVDDRPERVPVGARAVETQLGEAAARLRVEVVAQVDPDDWLRDLTAAIDSQPLLERGHGAAGAYARVYLLARRRAAKEGDPVPLLGPIPEPIYAVVGTDGELLMPTRELAEPGAISTLVQNLANRARWLHALELRPRDDPILEGAVHFEVLRHRDGGWHPVTPEDREFAENERFAIELSHRHCRPLHVYVLNFSVEGEISLVYPAEGVWEPIEPGRVVRYGVESADAVRFVLAGGYPFADCGGPVRAPEVLKLFATEEATDFRPLFQNRYRRVRGWQTVYQRSLLGQRLCQLIAGPRELQVREHGVVQPWTTVERRVSIRRRAG